MKMAVLANASGEFPAWLPETALLYLRHVEEGVSIRALARSEGCHASTVLRKLRRYENRREDPLVDEALSRLGLRISARSAGSAAEGDHNADNEDPLPMTAVPRSKDVVADETTVMREARRILRRLCETGAMLAIAPDLEKAVVLKGAQRVAVLDRTVAQAFALKDWIAISRSGKVTAYEITVSGRAALKRLLAEDQVGRAPGFAEAQAAFSGRFADQHRVWDERNVMEPGAAAPRRMRYNLAESPVAALARRKDKDGEPFLSQDLVVAAERLREDFELAQLGPRIAQNWERFLTGGERGGFQPGAGQGEGSSRARDRVAAALRDLGPGLGDMVLRTCCFLEGLEVAEKRLGWSARSGKIVLRIALMRLKRHYEETYGSARPLIG